MASWRCGTLLFTRLDCEASRPFFNVKADLDISYSEEAGLSQIPLGHTIMARFDHLVRFSFLWGNPTSCRLPPIVQISSKSRRTRTETARGISSAPLVVETKTEEEHRDDAWNGGNC